MRLVKARHLLRYSDTNPFSIMAIENPENWYLKKHEDGEVFGPVPFGKIKEWAQSAQVNPQDMVSNDGTIWTKPPMIPELEMDWLIEVGQDLLYGPTTASTLLEFVQIGEISPETHVINCVSGDRFVVNQTPFYKLGLLSPPVDHADPARIGDAQILSPLKGGIRANLQKRVRELELALVDKRRQLHVAQDTISRLELKVKELEARIRDFSGFRGTK